MSWTLQFYINHVTYHVHLSLFCCVGIYMYSCMRQEQYFAMYTHAHNIRYMCILHSWCVHDNTSFNKTTTFMSQYILQDSFTFSNGNTWRSDKYYALLHGCRTHIYAHAHTHLLPFLNTFTGTNNSYMWWRVRIKPRTLLHVIQGCILWFMFSIPTTTFSVGMYT